MVTRKGGKRKGGPRKTGVETSKRVASIASKGVRAPSTLTTKEIQIIAGAALSNRQGPTVPVKRRSTKKKR